jgi:hypothetical protein
MAITCIVCPFKASRIAANISKLCCLLRLSPVNYQLLKLILQIAQAVQ